MNFRYECINDFEMEETAMAVFKVLEGIDFEFGNNKSNELKNRLNTEFKMMGWYNSMKVDPKLNWKIQYYYKDTAILYYFSNKARTSLDLVKVQHMFHSGRIKKAIYIVLSKKSANLMGFNIANFEILKNELTVFSDIFTVPILLIGIKQNQEK